MDVVGAGGSARLVMTDVMVAVEPGTGRCARCAKAAGCNPSSPHQPTQSSESVMSASTVIL